MQPAEEQPRNNGNWWSSTANWVKKAYFNGTHLIDKAFNDNQSPQVWIFGLKFKSNQDARVIFTTLLWITYREKLLFKQYPSVTSDVGWGCMIRVGQMMLAQTLRMNEGREMYYTKQATKRILNEFINYKGLYSFQKFVDIGYKLYQKKPGQWYNPSHMAFMIRQLQNSTNYGNLKVVVFDNEFQINTTLNAFSSQSTKIQKKSSSIMQDQSDHSILLIILFRIGLKSPQTALLKEIIQIMKNQSRCIGFLGGRPGRAHYILGTTNSQFLYLDPHCVKNSQDFEQFFCTNMFSIEHNKIDPSMGLCFYLRNKSQAIILHEKLVSSKGNLPFYSYAEGETPQIIERPQETQEFQLLQE